MIAKHITMNAATKSSFGRLVHYLTDAQGKEVRAGPARITNCMNDSAEVAALEVLNTQMMNTRSRADKTYHLLISFRRDESPDPAALAAIEDRLCDGLGFSGHQRVSVVHDDTDNLHLHVAINKIHPTRYTIHEPFHAYRILARLCETLENEYSLQADNHTPRQSGAQNRAADMEHHAGVESLLGWVKRECLEQMRESQSWEQLHAVLAENGLRLHQRANGLVITAEDGTTVKASSVARELSKPKLEQRFGPFQAVYEQQVAGKPAQRYEKKPLASRVDTTELYARYRLTQEQAAASRARGIEQARERRERRIEAAQRSVHLKRAALKLISMPGAVKKLMYKALTSALHEEVAAIKLRYLRERETIGQQHQHCQWADWLRQEAHQGDLLALVALRGRHSACGATGNAVTGESTARRVTRPNGHDSVTSNGTIIYRVGASAIRDDGDRLKVSLGADQDAMQSALRMAIARYGERIAVSGSDTFKEQILMAAVAGSMRVTFADAALEQRHLQLIRASDARSVATVPQPPATGVGCGAAAPADEVLFLGGTGTMTGRERAAGAADRYISEREQKRVNGFDIPKHARYTSHNAGTATYAGTRRVEGQGLALLRQGDQVMVLEVDDATVRRLKRLPLGAKVGVNAQGVITAKGRSR
jgi:hypothetical protein